MGTALGDLTAGTLRAGVFRLRPGVRRESSSSPRSATGGSLEHDLLFWFAYVATRPLGASFADWMGKAKSVARARTGRRSGRARADRRDLLLVAYLAITRVDLQNPEQAPGDDTPSSAGGALQRESLEQNPSPSKGQPRPLRRGNPRWPRPSGRRNEASGDRDRARLLLVKRVVTIGVYEWDLQAFLEALRGGDVRLLLDVRQRRGVRGREYAWANAVRLQHALGGTRDRLPTPSGLARPPSFDISSTQRTHARRGKALTGATRARIPRPVHA